LVTDSYATDRGAVHNGEDDSHGDDDDEATTTVPRRARLTPRQIERFEIGL
jgi:hypothetical protein